jgi:hypothetical protein
MDERTWILAIEGTTGYSSQMKQNEGARPVISSCALIDPSDWVDPTLSLAEGGELIRFHIRDAFHYHGYDAVGGVVLGFRLLQKALHLWGSGEPIQRREITLFTAFPGLGARDCFELVTRMATENRIATDVSFEHPAARLGVQGRLFFRFTYRGRTLDLAPIASQPSDEFIRLGKASKLPQAKPEILDAWRRAKYELANMLLGIRADEAIRVL